MVPSAHFLPRFISHCERSVKKQVIRPTRRAHNPKSNYFSFCSLIQSKKRTPCGVLFALAPRVGLQVTSCPASFRLANLTSFPSCSWSVSISPLLQCVFCKLFTSQDSNSLKGLAPSVRRNRSVLARQLEN